MENRCCMILEGGAMRCSFTAGVLDQMLISGLAYPDTIVGVSAGALSATSYLTGQIGRSIRVSCSYCRDPRMGSLRNMRRSGNYVDPEFFYHRVQEELDPCNFDAFNANSCELIAVCGDIVSGQPVYLPVKDLRADIEALRASASLPIVSKPVEINGRLLMDGGIMDPMPVDWALQQGYQHIIVVLTREAGYVKAAEKRMILAKRLHSAYPALLDAMERRHELYNAQHQRCLQLAQEGRICLVLPQIPVGIPQMEKDPAKLVELYNQGLAQAKAQHDELAAALGR